MKTTIRNIIYYLMLGMMMISCSTFDDMPEQVNETIPLEAKQVDLLVSISSKASNLRQAPTLTHRAPTFSTMDLMVAIPYRTNGANVTASDNPLIDLVGANESNLAKKYDAEKYNTYYVNTCHLMTSTDRMLVYGKAKPVSNEKKINGELSPLPTDRKKTADIQFSLTSIRESTTPHADALALANYMTSIANTTGWSTTDDPTLKSYYLDFIRMGSEGAGLMSGAAANIKAFVAALKALLTGRDDALSTAIIDNIDDDDAIEENTYPQSLGLPDGAAAIRWTGSQFEVKTTTTQLDNINGINRYTYPAELMFFVDSPIRTSAEEVSETTYQSNTQLWSAFLDTYYNGSTAVTTDTKAVAVANPIQYGVAKLDLTLTGMSATLMDAKDKIVPNADMSTMPLRGVIIGGQHTVGFNMKPQGEQTDVDGRFIYETTVDATSLATEGSADRQRRCPQHRHHRQY